MKKLLILLMIICSYCQGQKSSTSIFQGLTVGSSGILNGGSDCGTWEKKPIYYTEWEAIDTIVKPVKTEDRNWVYDQEKMTGSNMTLAIYAPCGLGTPAQWIQRRVCSITGIIQERRKVQEYYYVPKEKSEYQKTIDSLKNK